jgi:hypothetical protein
MVCTERSRSNEANTMQPPQIQDSHATYVHLKQIRIIQHYRKRALCRVPEALGKGFAECDTRQRRLGKQCIDKAFFVEYFFLGTRQRGLLSAREHSAKKSGRYGDGVTETASLPSVCPVALDKDSIIAECPLGHSAKSPPGRVPMSGSLSSALCGTRQSVPLCRVPAT